MLDATNPFSVPMPEAGDTLFRRLARRDGGLLVHPEPTDADGNPDVSTRRYLYEEGYKHAADLLADAARADPNRDLLLYPIAFLYRHYLELKLKALLNCMPWEPGSEPRMKADHDLQALWTTVTKSLLPVVWPEREPDLDDAVSDCIEEVHKIDPSSFAFRYPEDKKWNQTLRNLESVDVSNLKAVVADLKNAGLQHRADHVAQVACRHGTSVRTVWRWCSKYRRQGLHGLADRRPGPARSGHVSVKAWMGTWIVRDWIWGKLSRPECHERLVLKYQRLEANARFYKLPSTGTVSRFITDLGPLLHAYRDGPEAVKHALSGSYRAMGKSALVLLEWPAYERGE
ncbi:MAG TPA: helix-turn-helix domain-containing protein [Terriglobia bacterium]|nr:helix-turn-helix domain-containing protein [Terriglobia bacterium]